MLSDDKIKSHLGEETVSESIKELDETISWIEENHTTEELKDKKQTIENKYNAMFSKMHAESGQTPNTTSMPEQPPSGSNGPTIDEVD